MEKQYSVVKLLKNHLYPTYQLYCEMGNHKLTVAEGLRYGALTVLSWLRERLGGDVPKQLQLPPAEDYAKVKNEDLVSFHMNCGFVVDIISLPQKGLWTLQITEPDLGPNPGTENQSRPPVAGRIIETNIGFYIEGDKLFMGVLTVISDPENVPLAEVYRPAFVRKLYLDENFGLCQLLPITGDFHSVRTKEQVAAFENLWRNTDNQLPCVLLMEQKTLETVKTQVTYLNIDDISKDPKGKFTGIYDHKFKGMIPEGLGTGPIMPSAGNNIPEDLENVKITYLPPKYDVSRLASSMAAYARIFVVSHSVTEDLSVVLNEEVGLGDVVVAEPQNFGGLVKVYHGDELTDESLRSMMQNYIRGKVVDFGNLYFANGARDALEQRTTELQMASAEQEQKWQVEKAMLDSRWQAKLDEKNRALSQWEKQTEKLQQQLTVAEAKTQGAQDKLKQLDVKYQQKLTDKDEYIAYLQRRLTRPHTKKELAQWVANNLGEHLYLHPRAVQLLEAAEVNPERLELIYDALEYLATDYWENRYGGLSSDDMNNRMAQKYGRGFLITTLRDGSIEAFEEQYKVPYASGSHKPTNRKLDYHLKIGNKTEHLVRIYFFHDEDKKLIVIGSLPDHLDTMKIG